MFSLCSRRIGYCVLLSSLSGLLTFGETSAKAQIIPDTTLGSESSIVSPQFLPDRGLVDLIQGGGDS